MADPTFDCYLCGTSNDADADFCTKCSGRLLKLPDVDDGASDNVEAEVIDEAALMADFEDQPEVPEEHPAPKGRKNPIAQRRARSIHTSLEDQRLSDALGMTEDVDVLDTLTTDVTSIPRARAAENIPVLGTRNASPSTPIQFVDDDRVSPVTYLIVAILLLATAWFGYNTLFQNDRVGEPSNIAFSDATTTTAPATTTTEPDTGYSASQINFIFERTLVRVVPYACSASPDEPTGDMLVGVAVNDRSVVLPGEIPAGTNVVLIINQTGTTRVAVVSQENGLTVATSDVLTTRSLDITATTNSPDFFVGYDLETEMVTTAQSPQGLDAEISVGDEGELHQVRLGSSVHSASALADLRVIDVDGSRGTGNPCAAAAALSIVPPEVTEAGENETGAGLEETDAE